MFTVADKLKIRRIELVGQRDIKPPNIGVGKMCDASSQVCGAVARDQTCTYLPFICPMSTLGH